MLTDEHHIQLSKKFISPVGRCSLGGFNFIHFGNFKRITRSFYFKLKISKM
jgi:hypothetical protein